MKRGKQASVRKRVREVPPAYGPPRSNRLLLDTHAWLWWRADDPRLGRQAREAIRVANAVYFSAASAWEIAIKTALGKLNFPNVEAIATELEQHGFQPLPIDVGHAIGIAALAKVHGDPFDRMLAAQAIAEGLVFVSADPVFRRYGVSVLSATS